MTERAQPGPGAHPGAGHGEPARLPPARTDAPRERGESASRARVLPAPSAAGSSRALSPCPLHAFAVIVAPSRCQQRSAAPALPGRTGTVRFVCCCKYEPPIPSPRPLPDRRVAAVKLPRGAFGNTPVPGFLPQICMTTSRETERATSRI